ncbi:MAG: YkgJ family cysteine cluster protein [Deltaproteobacteria bacterium]|nr:YkgJ family cysteine cluster protein [Deltaproteobacteria bacterium]
MIQTLNTLEGKPMPVALAAWNTQDLMKQLEDLLRSIVEEEKNDIPVKRVQRQLERELLYQEIQLQWPKMAPNERLAAWKKLIQLSEQAAKTPLPTCVGCGECCRKGSPTLHSEDLELLREGKIPWADIYTLRAGEPVRSPFQEGLTILTEERIKLREKPGSTECCFFDGETDQCTIYLHRPLQCRAQACWDPRSTTRLTDMPHLTRAELFQGVDLLLDLMEEHDQRCSFERLHKAFEKLHQTGGDSVEEVLRLLSYEDHFRTFLCDRLNIPDENRRLVFGRSFSELLPIFGLKLVTESDGSTCLVPDGRDGE